MLNVTLVMMTKCSLAVLFHVSSMSLWLIQRFESFLKQFYVRSYRSLLLVLLYVASFHVQ